MVEKIDKDNECSWIDDSYKQGKDRFQLSYKLLGSNFDIWQHFHEELHLHIFSYLNANNLITLCYVSKCFRKLVLKKFAKYYDLSTGFCSVNIGQTKLKKMYFD